MRPILLSFLILLSACEAPLGNGELGNPRYFGEIPGDTPMRLLPPVSDRDGNVYVAYGNRQRADTDVWVGRASGGWNSACSGHRGDFGIHGFIGQSDSEAWLWTGAVLLHIWGQSGTCHQVLNQDPVTGTVLDWLAVAPWVRTSPSRNTTVALVQATNANESYLTLLDLDREQMTQLTPLEPLGLEDLVILGTGAEPERDRILFAISYTSNGQRVDEALLLNSDGDLQSRIPLQLSAPPEDYSVLGFFQSNGNGAWAGVKEDGGLILVAPTGGYEVQPDFDAHGLLRTEENLFVTGLVGGSVVASRVANNLALEATREWRTPSKAEIAMNGPLSVFDERNSPLRKTTWTGAENAIGILPLLTAHPLDPYTTQSSGWLVAGPSYQGPAEQITSVAFAPIGWSSP